MWELWMWLMMNWRHENSMQTPTISGSFVFWHFLVRTNRKQSFLLISFLYSLKYYSFTTRCLTNELWTQHNFIQWPTLRKSHEIIFRPIHNMTKDIIITFKLIFSPSLTCSPDIDTKVHRRTSKTRFLYFDTIKTWRTIWEIIYINMMSKFMKIRSNDSEETLRRQTSKWLFDEISLSLLTCNQINQRII
jgi:hypothetical protein